MVNSTGNCWGMLPEEIQMEIVGKLGFKGLAALSEVNTLFKRLVNDEYFWKRRGQEIGLTGRDFENNPRSAIKKEVEKIKGQAIVAGIEKPSLNTPDEINHAKLQVLKKDYERLQNSKTPHKTPPESIQKLLNDRATPENLAKLERWLLARSTVIVYEGLKRENNNLTDLDARLLEGNKWEGIFNSYAEWSKRNQSELQNITNLNLSCKMILKLPPNIFDGLTSLNWIVLTHNRLSELPNLDKLKKLKGLNLIGNQLKELPNLDKLENLELLNLDTNRLSVLPPGIFNKLTSLKSLNLSRNKLSVLPERIFDKLTSLEWLDLSDNKINKNDPALQNLPDRISVFV